MSMLQQDGYVLRAPEPEDLDCMYKFENMPSLWEVSNTTGPYSRYFLKQYIEQSHNDIYQDRQLRLMIQNPEGKVVGIIDLFHFDPFHNRAEVGIVVDETCRCKGIGTMAVRLLARYCFRHLGIHQLYAYTESKNPASRIMFGKCGFVECALLKDWMRSGNTYGDVVLLQLVQGGV